MPEIHGNTEGIRKTVLDELTTLYDVQLEPGQFMPQDLLQSLCGYSASMNREIAVYITRFGEVADVLIGRADSIDLPDLRLRRGERRLSMVRCVHTHPRATGELSDVDVSALLSMRFDAMCAVGVSEDGVVTYGLYTQLIADDAPAYGSAEAEAIREGGYTLLQEGDYFQQQWAATFFEDDAQ